MATKKSSSNKVVIESTPKKSRQGTGKHTKYAATSRITVVKGKVDINQRKSLNNSN